MIQLNFTQAELTINTRLPQSCNLTRFSLPCNNIMLYIQSVSKFDRHILRCDNKYQEDENCQRIGYRKPLIKPQIQRVSLIFHLLCIYYHRSTFVGQIVEHTV